MRLQRTPPSCHVSGLARGRGRSRTTGRSLEPGPEPLQGAAVTRTRQSRHRESLQGSGSDAEAGGRQDRLRPRSSVFAASVSASSPCSCSLFVTAPPPPPRSRCSRGHLWARAEWQNCLSRPACAPPAEAGRGDALPPRLSFILRGVLLKSLASRFSRLSFPQWLPGLKQPRAQGRGAEWRSCERRRCRP